jgi:spore germination protein KB
MPHLAAVLAGRDGLAAICLATLAAALYTVFVLKAFKRYGCLDLFGITEIVLGKTAAQLLCYGFIIKGVLFSGFCLRVLGETVTGVIESPIPITAAVIAAALCILYAVENGLEVYTRLAEVCLVPFLLVLAFVFGCGLKDGKPNELLPVFAQSGKDILKAASTLLLWFYPIQYVMLSTPYINQKLNIKSCVKAVFVGGAVIAAVFAVTLMRFGTAQLTALAYPVLEMMYSVNLPSSFIERQEGLMLGIWTTGVFFTVGSVLCHCTEVTSLVFKGTSRGITSIICITAAVITALSAKNGSTAYLCMLNTLLIGESIYFIGLPLVLFLYDFLNNLREGKNNATKNN